MGRQLQPFGRCLIPSDDVLHKASRVYKVQPSGRQSSWSGRSSFNSPDITLQGLDAPKPYYGNYVQPKCNRLDARATPSGHSLVMEAFSATLERRLQFRTLGQAVRTPSDILVITFYSNIGLRQNQRRWKANKKCCKLMIWMAIKIVLKAPVRTEISSVRMALPKFENSSELLSGQGNSCPFGLPRLPSGCGFQRLHFLLKLGLLKPINKGF
jgi:hypothetical protein